MNKHQHQKELPTLKTIRNSLESIHDSFNDVLNYSSNSVEKKLMNLYFQNLSRKLEIFINLMIYNYSLNKTRYSCVLGK